MLHNGDLRIWSRILEHCSKAYNKKHNRCKPNSEQNSANILGIISSVLLVSH